MWLFHPHKFKPHCFSNKIITLRITYHPRTHPAYSLLLFISLLHLLKTIYHRLITITYFLYTPSFIIIYIYSRFLPMWIHTIWSRMHSRKYQCQYTWNLRRNITSCPSHANVWVLKNFLKYICLFSVKTHFIQKLPLSNL